MAGESHKAVFHILVHLCTIEGGYVIEKQNNNKSLSPDNYKLIESKASKQGCLSKIFSI
jgi:hypothetical protein